MRLITRAALGAATVLLLAAPAALHAIVSGVMSHTVSDKRLPEIEASLKSLKENLAKPELTDAERKALLDLEKSLLSEKKVLLDRRALVDQIEHSGVLMHVNFSDESAAVDLDAVLAPYHEVSRGVWEHCYSHTPVYDQTGAAAFRGKTVKYLLRGGGLAKTTDADGGEHFFAKELQPGCGPPDSDK